ncbi:AT-rich interactive domain-containing protein 3A [Microcaecilia unicolor]|uniref:AT-rich interactive domain-containing protein 3 n=1 Tax=Microcaecilia unicolor TaxID=1415580 RepID=A0A6P7Z7G5_9AMPH|nr:AT-rich interactive domain-containing protein 3A [Microcaecilia unicolor]XP_030075298.1 AT-rich interactive domain-containing protein 3A [Microcaecilia unicolor]
MSCSLRLGRGAIEASGAGLLASCRPRTMKLQAVMENLQRQQRVRLQQEFEARQQQERRESLPDSYSGNGSASREDWDPESVRMQRAQAQALAAMRAAAAGLSTCPSPGTSEEDEEEEEAEGQDRASDQEEEEERDPRHKWDEDDFEEDLMEGDEEEEEEDYDELEEEGLDTTEAIGPGKGPLLAHKQQTPQPFRGELQRLPGGQERQTSGVAHPAHSQLQAQDHGDWTYEEQFKQLYELDADPKRKEFLDDLFSFMQKRGTPVNRIPIMAKQVLDLYMLYVLVTEKGGLVEVINKKLWREITKGLNLPTSITSAAFTLRTQYMKYLYPYECEKRGLSNPNELQAAIDSNRREGRRQGFGGALFTYSPSGTPSILSSPKLQVPALGLATATMNGSAPGQKIKKEEDPPVPISVPSRVPVSLASNSMAAVQAAAAAVAAQAAALEQLRETLESGEPPEKKMTLVVDEQQRLIQRAIQQNLLAMTAQVPMNIKISSQGTRLPDNRQDSAVNLASNGTNSISMSLEINGIVYTGVLFAQTPSSSASSSYTKGNSNGRGSTSSGPPSATLSVPPAPISP